MTYIRYCVINVITITEAYHFPKKQCANVHIRKNRIRYWYGAMLVTISRKKKNQKFNRINSSSHSFGWVYIILGLGQISHENSTNLLSDIWNCGLWEQSRHRRKEESDRNLCKKAIASKSHFHAGMIATQSSDFDIQRIFDIFECLLTSMIYWFFF